MPININKMKYFTASDVLDKLNVSRQTLWRWRQEGSIPRGHRFRNRYVVFTPQEVLEIEAHANRIDPIEPEDLLQPDLFQIPKESK